MTYGPPEPQRTSSGNDGFGITSMVLGILGLIFVWVPGFDVVTAVLAVIFGAVSIRSANRTGRAKGMAIAGLTLGIISLAGAIIVIVYIAALAGGASA